MEIKNLENITDEFNRLQESGKNPILTPEYPNQYQGKQVLINADRILSNAIGSVGLLYPLFLKSSSVHLRNPATTY